jgi:Ni/Fe-hydrogenase subunit HybB-like protein
MQISIHYPKLHLGKRSIDIFPYWIGLLVAGILVGLVGAFFVFRDGLQVTGLSNQVPWGLWISIDLSAIALGGCAKSSDLNRLASWQSCLVFWVIPQRAWFC